MTSDSTLADRITAIVLFLLGLAMLWGGYEMDRLEIRRIHPSSIPGLVPMILGGIMMVCAAALGLGTLQAPEETTAPVDRMDRGNWADFGFATVWSCIFAVFMVGTLPFTVATAIYVAVFSAWFLWPTQSSSARKGRMVALVALYAILVAIGVATLFERGFLVRLP